MPVWTAALALSLALCLLCASGARAASTGAMAWGSNGSGQVGNGTVSVSVPSPAPVSGLSNAVQISAASQSAHALLADGTVVGWGSNQSFQLAAPEALVKSAVPIPIAGLGNVIAIDSGREHGLALLADGTVMAWGRGDDGQLGIPPASAEKCVFFVDPEPCRRTPAPVPGLADVVAISASESSSFALLADGTVMAWGDDEKGQVGDGTGVSSGCRCVDHPVPVPGVRGAVAIASGAEGGAAVLADGSVRNWGTNIEGQIGDGTVGAPGACGCLGPAVVPGLGGVKALSGGNRFRLSLQADGSLRGWGANNVGQLGQGTTASPSASPTLAAPGLPPPQAISAGGFHTLALLAGGGVMAWGYNESGQLGDGTTTQRTSPQPVPGVAGASAVAGHDDTSFALIGPSQTLDVALAGAGSGSVGTEGLLCPGACAAKFPQGQTAVLRAQPATHETVRAEPGNPNGFAGWSGPCTGTGPCKVRMDTDQTVTATFGPPKGTAITNAKIEPKKKRASFSFTAPGAVTGYQCKLVRPLAKKPRKGKKKKGSKGAKSSATKKGGKKKKGKGKKKPKPPPFSACASPQTYKNLKPGKYGFEVRALNALGADAAPASRKFTLKKAAKPKKKGQKGKRSPKR